MITGTLESYDTIIKNIDELISYLQSLQIEAELNSHLEDDYLDAHLFYESYKKSPSDISCSKGRQALGGLHELYKWIWSVKDTSEFDKLKSHLALLVQAAPRINSSTPFLSPVTNKQDDKTNKFIEAIVGFFAVAYGRDVDLDDPINSSGGENPDVIFTYQGKRVSIACKTLHSKNPTTILQNIDSAAKQITRASCDKGYILLNGMNIIDHGKIQGKVFNTEKEPFNILRLDLESIYQSVLNNCKCELEEIFSLNPKAIPIVITTIHSVTQLNSNFGVLSTSLKGTIITNFRNEDEYDEQYLTLPIQFNNFIHNII